MTGPLRERRQPELLLWAMIVCAIGACLNFVGLGFAMHRIGAQASAGQRARATQCAREPIIRKLVVAGERYRLLDHADVATYRRTAPDCP